MTRRKDYSAHLRWLEEQSNPLAVELIQLVRSEMKPGGESGYQIYMESYFDFHRSLTGLPPRITPAQGAALKRIISYLESSAPGDAPQLWEAILQNWGKLNPFLGSQTSLIQIDKNLTEIIAKIKFANRDERKEGKHHSVTAAEQARAAKYRK